MKLANLEAEHAECSHIHTSSDDEINCLKASLKRAQEDLSNEQLSSEALRIEIKNNEEAYQKENDALKKELS